MKIILEFNEFNALRLNPEVGSSTMPIAVDNPSLSMNAFDRHINNIQHAFNRLNDINMSMSNTSAYSDLRSKMALDDQNISSLKILRIISNNLINYNVYISFVVKDVEYWGVVENILNDTPTFKSEVFKDSFNLVLSKEYIIKTSGIIIKHIKNWMCVDKGYYTLLLDDMNIINSKDGTVITLEKGDKVYVKGSSMNKINLVYKNEDYTLSGKRFIYFNYWFEPID